MNCCNFLCFIGLHKFKNIKTLSMPVKISKHRKIYYTQKQCQRCCKIVRLDVYDGPVTGIKKSDIKNCNI